MPILGMHLIGRYIVGTENAMANDVPTEFLSEPQTEEPKVEPPKNWGPLQFVNTIY